MFCPQVTVTSVKPYIILTFLPTSAVSISSQKGSFCVQLDSPVGHTGRCHIPTQLEKKSHQVVVIISSWRCSALACGVEKLKTQQNKVDGSWCLCCIYDWLLLNMITDDTELILDSAQHRVPFSEQHVRTNVSLWHGATSNCLPKALWVNSPDSFLDKSCRWDT